MAIWIGLDPGENTGVAVWDGKHQELTQVLTLPIHRAMDLVKKEHYAALMEGVDLCVIFEDARQRKWFPQEKNNAEYRGRLMGAGAAKRDAKIWEEYLTDLHIPFRAQKPRPGLTKWSADYWAKITGWEGRTSEHARDAALLVYGRP